MVPGREANTLISPLSGPHTESGGDADRGARRTGSQEPGGGEEKKRKGMKREKEAKLERALTEEERTRLSL